MRNNTHAHAHWQARMTVCLQNGESIEDCIYVSPSQPPVTSYETIIYYHTNAPKWNETVKLDIPHTSYDQAHLRFEIFHCSSTKKPAVFCFAYKRLSESGALKDGLHALPVYKFDHKYHNPKGGNALPYLQPNTMAPNSRDHFSIITNSCSTRRSQDANLMSFLERRWKQQDNRTTLLETLSKLQEVNGTEIVKFLPRVFDCIFDTLDDLGAQPAKNVEPAFGALMYVLGELDRPQFRNFKSVVDKYIQRTFSNRRAHEFLSKAMIDSNTRVLQDPSPIILASSVKTMKALEYVFRFMVKSREIRNGYSNVSNQDDREFKAQVHRIFASFSKLMESKTPAVGQVQEECLATFATVFNDLLIFYTSEELSKLAKDFLTTVQKSGKNQLLFVKHLAQSTLFRDDGGRKELLETVLRIAAKYFSDPGADMAPTLDIVGNILTSLNGSAFNFAPLPAVFWLQRGLCFRWWPFGACLRQPFVGSFCAIPSSHKTACKTG